MFSFKSVLKLFLIFTVFLFLPKVSESQIIRTTGNPDEASSQLVYWYDNTVDGVFDILLSTIQVTNTNPSEGVFIHVQIFRSFDPTDTGNDDADKSDVIRCEERDFVDFLTPNDTHVYFLNETNFTKNTGESEGTAGELTTIDLADTKGFILITPIVSESDFSAISFQHLTGNSGIANINPTLQGFRVNAMGRDAVDFATGEEIADGIVLDGVSNGFVLLQPDELSFSFIHSEGDGVMRFAESYVVGVNFIDSYGTPGLLGYNVIPGETTWTSFLFDFKENPTSCGNLTNSCFMSVGVYDEYPDANTELDDLLLCSAVDLPDLPQDPFTVLNLTSGYAKIFISGLDSFENQLGLFAFQEIEGLRGGFSQAGASWMFTK